MIDVNTDCEIQFGGLIVDFEAREGSEMEHTKTKYRAFGSNNEGYQTFLRSMHEGIIEPGSTVTQTELCKKMNMSVTPLRECLVLLEEYGLVEVRPRAGIKIVYPDISFFRSNMQFRTIIEKSALPSFVEKSEDEVLDSLQLEHIEGREKIQKLDDISSTVEELAKLDKYLHSNIVEALHNTSISAAHHRLQDNLSLCKLVHTELTYRQNLIDTYDEHLVLIEAVKERDYNAAIAALNAHLRASTYRMFT